MRRRSTESSYRAHFTSAESAYEYETSVYGGRGYGEVLWRIEQARLHSLVEEFRSTHKCIDYLDFATGTGRILSFMEGLVDTATGIDISEAMVERASHKVVNARIICRDITRPDAPLEGQYDLITAFRFALNAEPPLRLAAFRALAGRLRDESSWLIFNNHGFPWSYRLLGYPVYAARGLGNSRSKPAYLTHGEVKRVTEEAGLRIDRITGCGLFSGKITRFVSFDTAVRWEERAAQHSMLSRFGMNQIYVARLR